MNKCLRAAKLSIFAFVLLTGPLLSAQQLTRVAVVNLSRIVAAFPTNASLIAAIEQKKAQIQADINAQSAEIGALIAQKDAADKAGNAKDSSDLQATIESKSKSVTDYAKAKQAELDEMAKGISASSTFSQNLLSAIQNIAEGQGYSIVLDSSKGASSSILWFSPMIDITDDVVKSLQSQ